MGHRAALRPDQRLCWHSAKSSCVGLDTARAGKRRTPPSNLEGRRRGRDRPEHGGLKVVARQRAAVGRGPLAPRQGHGALGEALRHLRLEDAQLLGRHQRAHVRLRRRRRRRRRRHTRKQHPAAAQPGRWGGRWRERAEPTQSLAPCYVETLGNECYATAALPGQNHDKTRLLAPRYTGPPQRCQALSTCRSMGSPSRRPSALRTSMSTNSS